MFEASPALLRSLLGHIADDIVPLTERGVSAGNKVFGSAILRKSNLSLVVAGTNNEIENPLWHGEVHTLKLFYEMPERPATKDCIFIATHEPCSLCLSAITWTGFDNFFYLFPYADTEGLFGIPHDLKILKDIFRVEGGDYAKRNAYWTATSIPDAVAAVADVETRETLQARIADLRETYARLSQTYQASKDGSDIPLA